MNDGIVFDNVAIQGGASEPCLHVALPNFANVKVTNNDSPELLQAHADNVDAAKWPNVGDVCGVRNGKELVTNTVGDCIRRYTSVAEAFTLQHAAMVSAHDRICGDLSQLAVVLIFGGDDDRLYAGNALRVAESIYCKDIERNQPNMSTFL